MPLVILVPVPPPVLLVQDVASPGHTCPRPMKIHFQQPLPVRPVPLIPTVQATTTLLLIARTARRLARPTLGVSSNVMIRSPIVLIFNTLPLVGILGHLVESDKQWTHTQLKLQLTSTV